MPDYIKQWLTNPRLPLALGLISFGLTFLFLTGCNTISNGEISPGNYISPDLGANYQRDYACVIDMPQGVTEEQTRERLEFCINLHFKDDQ